MNVRIPKYRVSQPAPLHLEEKARSKQPLTLEEIKLLLFQMNCVIADQSAASQRYFPIPRIWIEEYYRWFIRQNLEATYNWWSPFMFTRLLPVSYVLQMGIQRDYETKSLADFADIAAEVFDFNSYGLVDWILQGGAFTLMTPRHKVDTLGEDTFFDSVNVISSLQYYSEVLFQKSSQHFPIYLESEPQACSLTPSLAYFSKTGVPVSAFILPEGVYDEHDMEYRSFLPQMNRMAGTNWMYHYNSRRLFEGQSRVVISDRPWVLDGFKYFSFLPGHCRFKVKENYAKSRLWQRYTELKELTLDGPTGYGEKGKRMLSEFKERSKSVNITNLLLDKEARWTFQE